VSSSLLASASATVATSRRRLATSWLDILFIVIIVIIVSSSTLLRLALTLASRGRLLLLGRLDVLVLADVYIFFLFLDILDGFTLVGSIDSFLDVGTFLGQPLRGGDLTCFDERQRMRSLVVPGQN
jgi:hypothetical protein